jgi:hypothetical protein
MPPWAAPVWLWDLVRDLSDYDRVFGINQQNEVS